jgi:hypothetical protein
MFDDDDDPHPKMVLKVTAVIFVSLACPQINTFGAVRIEFFESFFFDF